MDRRQPDRADRASASTAAEPEPAHGGGGPRAADRSLGGPRLGTLVMFAMTTGAPGEPSSGFRSRRQLGRSEPAPCTSRGYPRGPRYPDGPYGLPGTARWPGTRTVSASAAVCPVRRSGPDARFQTSDAFSARLFGETEVRRAGPPSDRRGQSGLPVPGDRPCLRSALIRDEDGVCAA
jgi:hypothetical protein